RRAPARGPRDPAPAGDATGSARRTGGGRRADGRARAGARPVVSRRTPLRVGGVLGGRRGIRAAGSLLEGLNGGGPGGSAVVTRLVGVSGFADLGAIDPQGIWGGVVVRAVHGDRVTLGVVELEPDSHVAEHSHENEQLGLVLSGSVTFRIGDASRELGPGGIWLIPANAPHEVRTGPEGAVVIDVFAPTRDDWSALETPAPRAPRWP